MTITPEQYRNYFILPGLPNPKVRANPQYIINTVCEHYKMKRSDVLKHDRHQPIAHYRMIIQYLLKECNRFTNKEIGSLTGGYDHATILHAKKVISNRMEVDSKFRREINNLKQILG